MAMFGFPHWQLKSTSTESGVVAPDERLPFAQTAVMGVQHAVAMFGATVLMPILMGLDPTRILVMSQVLLSFGIALALVPLLVFTSNGTLMGDLVNTAWVKYIGWMIVVLVVALNIWLLVGTALGL